MAKKTDAVAETPAEPVVDEPVVVYPLPAPAYDPNPTGPSLEAALQELADAKARIAVLEAKLAEVTAE